MKSYNSFKIRILLAGLISLPAYTVLILIQNSNIFEVALYAYAEYTLAVFVSLVILLEFQNWKSNLLEEKLSWKDSFTKRLISELTITFIITPVLITASYYSFYNFYWDMSIYFPSAIFYNSIGIFISLFFLAFVNAGYFLTNWKNASIRAEVLEKENIKSQLIALQNQLSPHFLFNNFNILSALMDEDLDTAKRYLHNLSEVFRYILQNKYNEVVSLEDELKFITNYSFLLQTRFKKKFNLRIEVEEQYKKLKIPPVSLQVVLENALQHNEVSEKYPLQVDITSDGQEIVVTNKIKPKKGKINSTKTGLNNIARRYEFITYKKLRINNDNEMFTIALPLIE